MVYGILIVQIKQALKKAKDAEIKRKENFANSIKGRISNIYSNLFYNDATDLDFILKSNRYELSSPELTLSWVISWFM